MRMIKFTRGDFRTWHAEFSSAAKVSGLTIPSPFALRPFARCNYSPAAAVYELQCRAERRDEAAAIKIQTEARTIVTLANCMTEIEASLLLTLAHEPELLLDAGDIVPTIDPLLIAAAQMVGERMAA